MKRHALMAGQLLNPVLENFSTMNLSEYIEALKNYKTLAPDIVCHKSIPGKEAQYGAWPTIDRLGNGGFGNFSNARKIFSQKGIDRLYLHQKEAVEQISKGIHTVVATPTASGKSLIYNLPVLETLLEDANARALYLFPLKALARDQLGTVRELLKIAQAIAEDSSKSKAADGLFATHSKAGEETANPSSIINAIPSDRERVTQKLSLSADVYDGDLTSYTKSKIRNNPPNFLLTNPEMLHLSMLAHHHLWEDFFRSLRYVVVDEVHTYRGVMGSHMAWVFRRLIRICRYYGTDPVFIFCSATIDNPVELASGLTGLEVQLVDGNHAPAGQKEILLMGGMAGAAQTAIQLMHAAIHRGLRTIVYAQSRKITELIAMWATQRAGELGEKISAYRAGFLPEERREIEEKLSSGELLAVVSTSALELGIDIGNLDLCILVGYPGTIMSTWQRAGRVGRDGKASAMIFVAHEDALDHYFMNNPDEFFSMPPEKAVINPYNEVIMARHLECAAADLSIKAGEAIIADDAVRWAMEKLERDATLLRSSDGSTWFSSRKSPHREVNLRGTGSTIPIFLAELMPEAESAFASEEGLRFEVESPPHKRSAAKSFKRVTPSKKSIISQQDGQSNPRRQKPLGSVDLHRAFYETHEGAVYLHHGETYVVGKFDHEKRFVEVNPERVSYFTRARSHKSTEILEITQTKSVWNCRIGLGRLQVTDQVTGFERKTVKGQKSLGIVPLDLPPNIFETEGLWIEIPLAVQDYLESNRYHFMGAIHALEHAAIGILPLLVMTDRNDLGGISIPFHPQIEGAAVFIYDGTPGGIGLSRQAFEGCDVMLERTFNAIASCKCEFGCPACVHSPKCGSGNRPIDKLAALTLLEEMKEQRPERLPCKTQSFSPSSINGEGENTEKRGNLNITAPPAMREMALTPIYRGKSNGSSNVKERVGRFESAHKIVKDGDTIRYGVLDLETRRSAKEVGGWHKADRMGVSCVVVYDSKSDQYIEYLQEDVPRLERDLLRYDLIIGFNIVKFDYKVLGGLSDFNFHGLPTLDLLVNIYETLGYRLSLNRLAEETLGEAKSADGLLALKWWKEGRLREIIDYCIQDVKVTKDLYLFGKDNGYLLFKNKAGKKVRLPVKF